MIHANKKIESKARSRDIPKQPRKDQSLNTSQPLKKAQHVPPPAYAQPIAPKKKTPRNANAEGLQKPPVIDDPLVKTK